MKVYRHNKVKGNWSESVRPRLLKTCNKQALKDLRQSEDSEISKRKETTHTHFPVHLTANFLAKREWMRYS